MEILRLIYYQFITKKQYAGPPVHHFFSFKWVNRYLVIYCVKGYKMITIDVFSSEGGEFFYNHVLCLKLFISN